MKILKQDAKVWFYNFLQYVEKGNLIYQVSNVAKIFTKGIYILVTGIVRSIKLQLYDIIPSRPHAALHGEPRTAGYGLWQHFFCLGVFYAYARILIPGSAHDRIQSTYRTLDKKKLGLIAAATAF